MNTSEIKVEHKIKNFEQLFHYAKKQFYAYEKIEGISDWKEYDFSIDCASDQQKIKDLLQIRFIEELCEASEAIGNKEHFYEEITDALNFFLSAYVMVGKDFKDLTSPEEIYSDKTMVEKIPVSLEECGKLFFPLVYQVGMLCNLLKNRSWAQSNYLVSLFDFDRELEKLWNMFWKMIVHLGIRKNDLFDLFEKKYKVNQWRMKTGY